MKIKYKVWDKINSLMIYQDDDKSVWEMPNKRKIESIKQKSVVIYYEVEDGSDRGHYTLEHWEFELLENIGVQDHDDNEIYRGDIVEIGHNDSTDDYYEEYLGVVKYSEEEGRFFLASDKMGMSGFTHEGYDAWDNATPLFRILGNIYSNPELLINKKD